MAAEPRRKRRDQNPTAADASSGTLFQKRVSQLHAAFDAATGQQKESHPEGWTSQMKELIAGLCQH
jgi:hypothetical protein